PAIPEVVHTNDPIGAGKERGQDDAVIPFLNGGRARDVRLAADDLLEGFARQGRLQVRRRKVAADLEAERLTCPAPGARPTGRLTVLGNERAGAAHLGIRAGDQVHVPARRLPDRGAELFEQGCRGGSKYRGCLHDHVPYAFDGKADGLLLPVLRIEGDGRQPVAGRIETHGDGGA